MNEPIEPDLIEAALVEFFKTKPKHKKTTVFMTSDLYLTPRTGLTTEIKGARRRLAKWIFDRTEEGPTEIKGYKIRVHTATVPFRYEATRMQGG